MPSSISSTTARSFSSAGIIRLVLSLLLLSSASRANPITGQLRRAAHTCAGDGRTTSFFTSAMTTTQGGNRGTAGGRYHEINPSFINRTDDDAETKARSRSNTKKLSDEDDSPLVSKRVGLVVRL
eukprot:CAMPEP_0181057442 /NCGR_PEP_ID=MMETSP1070-20121207/20252_1 /TAXON_ID=265543 /ORGANISM="Minutocellus polymorphus, Strain NH13" /LENGTH=124 /DNA_ID=CAMNT_0023136855 /DNA_START=12 /DNA_END=386 /DNA_ORIENTATION=+